MLNLYFVRHGESEANLLHVFSNRGHRHPLTLRGVDQAVTLARKLKAELDGPLLAIYSSPILRAVQTAEILVEHLGVPYEVAHALNEYDVGIYEDRSDEEGWNRYSEVVREWVVNGNFAARMEEGESFEDIEARFLPFIDALKEAYRGREGNIILVGHGGTYMCMLPRILSNVDFPFAQENGMANTAYVLAEARGATLVCTRWGDIDLRAET